jgi:hypothetical protein
MERFLDFFQRVLSHGHFLTLINTLEHLRKQLINLIDFLHPTLRARSIPSEKHYQYQPLPSPRHIRLLRLLKPRGLILPAELEIFAIDDAPEYDALSYTWGEPRIRFGLSVGEKLIPVPGDNLLRFLRAVAFRGLAGGRWIWIDAICINQKDEQEKYHQIPLMREIYSGAEEVLAWLGDGSFLESLILNEEVIPAVRAAVSGPTPELQILQPYPGGRFADRYNAPIPFGMMRRTLMSIYDRPYFRRIWIQQEIVLGKNVWVLCGHAKVSWEVFVQLSDTCSYQGQPYVSEIIGLKRHRDNWQSENPDYGQMVNAINTFARDKEATDPKDRVLGLLGLCPPETFQSLSVDAGLSIAEVYIQFARWNLSLRRFQHILLTLDYAHHFSGLPSWCPNLMWGGGPRIHWDKFCAGYRSGTENNGNRLKGIPGHEEAPEARWSDPQVIELPATLAVDEIGAVLPWEDKILTKANHLDLSHLLAWESACIRLLAKLEDSMSEQELTAHATTLIADSMEGLPRFVSPRGYHAGPIRCYKLWKTLLVSYAHQGAEMESPAEFFDYTTTLLHVCKGQSYFATKGGRRGVCSQAAKPGDLVIVIQNSNSPAIMRPLAGGKKRDMIVIGPAYVDGLMYGEALERVQNGGEQWETVYIH